MEDAADIVRDLADTLDPVEGLCSSCLLCGAWAEPEGDMVIHGDDCPWLRAREWIAAHPKPDMMELRDVTPDGTVFANLRYPRADPIPGYIYGEFYPDGPWERQVRELPEGEWRTVGGRYEDGSFWWTSVR